VIGVKAAGDAALLLNTGPQAAGAAQDGNGAALLAAAIRAAALPGVIDVVPGAVTVLVSFEPGSWIPADLADRLTAIAAASPAGGAATDLDSAHGRAGRRDGSPGVAEIDVVYDGPDLADVASLTGLTVADVVARHQAATFRVGWLGFAPGFGYLTGLDPRLATVPRLDSPRQHVPAGSVAIAGGLAAVYPAASPGGWRLLGRTSAALWEPGRDPPALLAPGMRVRFRAVDALPPARAPASVSAPAPIAAGARLIEVLQPGPLTTVQDLGRAGLAHLGVPASGAADAGSLRLANDLVGNDAGAACLEVTLGRLAVRFHSDALVAVTGAPVSVRLSAADGGAVSDRGLPSDGPPRGGLPGGRHPGGGLPGGGEIASGVAVSVPAGSVLRLGVPATGLRSYVAIDGGISVSPVLGSRSTDSLSGLGPEPLRPGDWLPVGQPRSRPEQRGRSRPRGDGPGPGAGSDAVVSGPVELRVIAGPRDDWFTGGALSALGTGSFTVRPASNRTGLRLSGPALDRSRPGELLSEGMATGSLQVTHDGQPILLLADHPTTGGYPVIGVVASADLGLAAQLRPGQQVRFQIARGDPL
jgi:KipI family sensor histidine kinase inhibitor